MNDELFLNERVDVVARFGASTQPCVPVKFRRKNGREIVVTELGLRTPVAAGRKTVHMFDVTDGEADYRLEFDSERLTWRLTMEGDRL
ncbi:MAG: hypothetical protein ACM3KF_01405 [Acidobacteriota bacterium]